MFMEYLTKNAKKLVSIAEEFDCPEIIKTAYKYGVIKSKNKKNITTENTVSKSIFTSLPPDGRTDHV